MHLQLKAARILAPKYSVIYVVHSLVLKICKWSFTIIANEFLN